MSKKLTLMLFCMLPSILFAADEGLHCKQVYIDVGASRADVSDVCGEPLDRDKDDGHWVYKDDFDDDYKTLVFGKDGVVDIISEVPGSILDDIVSSPAP